MHVAIDELFCELIAQQQKRVLQLASCINPRLTEEDLLQPHDFPELRDNSSWNYEDGILTGLRQAHMAVRTAFFKPTPTQENN